MPELPEVETVRQGLDMALAGKRIARVVARRPDLRFPLPEDLGQRLTGKTVTGTGRRGKTMFVFLGEDDDADVLIVHLGMSGALDQVDGWPGESELDKHDHVLIQADDGKTVKFNDPRRFGYMLLTTRAGLADHPRLKRLGPEPLSDAFTAASLSAALKGRRGSIKAALLDQSVVAGLGNIYVCEALFAAAISPKRQAGTVAGKRAERLVPAIVAVLRDALASGGSTLRDYRGLRGDLGKFQHRFSVYDREGRPCPGCDCDVAKTGGIQRITQSGRSTFYCKVRQR